MKRFKADRWTSNKRKLEECHIECDALLAMAEMKMKNERDLSSAELENLILSINELLSNGNRIVDDMLLHK